MKFRYCDRDHDLNEIVGKENIFLMKGSKSNFIITTKGITKLQHFFPEIDISFGSIQQVFLGDTGEILALEGVGRNNKVPEAPVIRTFGEVNVKNIKTVDNIYPIATLESRTKNRVLLKMLGLTDLISEEELNDVNATNWETKNQVIDRDSEHQISETIVEIKQLASDLNLSESSRMDVYKDVLRNPNLTVEQIADSLTLEVVTKVRNILQEKYGEKRAGK